MKNYKSRHNQILFFTLLLFTACTKDNMNVVERAVSENFTSVKYLTATQLTSPRFVPEAAGIGSKIYFGPGADETFLGLDKIDIYDTISKTWSVLKMPKPKLRPFITSYGSKIFLAGGISGYQIYKEIEVYDTITKIWTTYPYQYPHLNGGQIVSGKYIYIAGGQNNYNGFSNSKVEIFDMEALKYLPEMKISVARNSPYFYEVKNKLFFFWGYDSYISGSNLIIVDIYNKDTKHWDSTSVPLPRDETSWAYYPNGVYGNKIVFTSSSNNYGSINDDIDIYDTEIKTWESFKNVTKVWGQEMLIAGNLMIFAGGRQDFGTGKSYEYVNVFNLTNKKWQSIKLPHPRTFVSILRYGNKVYISGGSNNYILSDVVDILELVP